MGVALGPEGESAIVHDLCSGDASVKDGRRKHYVVKLVGRVQEMVAGHPGQTSDGVGQPDVRKVYKSDPGVVQVPGPNTEGDRVWGDTMRNKGVSTLSTVLSKEIGVTG